MRRWVETWLARLTEWIRELIPETGWCIFEWAICDFQWGDGSDSLILNEDDDNDNGEQERVTTDEERVLRESWTEIRLLRFRLCHTCISGSHHGHGTSAWRLVTAEIATDFGCPDFYCPDFDCPDFVGTPFDCYFTTMKFDVKLRTWDNFPSPNFV